MSQRILIPIEFPDPHRLPDTLIHALKGNEVVLLGWNDTEEDLPAETSPSEFRRSMEAHLHEEAARFLKGGADVVVKTHHGGDRKPIRDRIAEEEDVNAIYVPRSIASFGRLLVPLRDERTVDEIVAFLGGLELDEIVHITLFHVSDEEDPEGIAAFLDDVEDRIEDAGMPGVSIDTEVVVDDDPGYAIGAKAKDYDAVVMGQTQESVSDGIFGLTYERVADRADDPVIVVRRE